MSLSPWPVGGDGGEGPVGVAYGELRQGESRARRTSLWGSLYGRARAALMAVVLAAVMLMGVAPA